MKNVVVHVDIFTAPPPPPPWNPEILFLYILCNFSLLFRSGKEVHILVVLSRLVQKFKLIYDRFYLIYDNFNLFGKADVGHSL